MNDPHQDQGSEPRLPYEAPAVVEDHPLESFSLACDRLAGQCDQEGGTAVT